MMITANEVMGKLRDINANIDAILNRVMANKEYSGECDDSVT